jgi:alpha-methylacyl-CoA racemase
MFLAYGVCAALLSVSKTGKGQVVDAAMIDGVSSLLTILYSLSQSGIWKINEKGSNLFDGGAPFYQTYETKDNKYVSVGSLEPQFYQLLIEKLNLDKEFNSQMDISNWPNMIKKLDDLFKTKTQKEWNDLLENTDVCYAPVLSIDEVKNHPHMKARNNFLSIDNVLQPSPAPRFSETYSEMPQKAPDVGENNEEILLNLGYTSDEINHFKEKKVIK